MWISSSLFRGRSSRARFLPRLALATALITVGPTLGAAAPGFTMSGQDTLQLADAIQAARTANPMLRATRLRALAATERVAPAGAWSDPELAIGLVNRPLGGAGMAEPMTMTTVRLSQMVPWPGTRPAGRDAALARADADSLLVLEESAMLDARVAESYYELAATDRAIGVLEESRALLEGLREVALARYAVGEVPQQDVLQAQVSLARMEAELIAMRGERRAEAARFNAWLARDPWTPVEALHLPFTVDSMPPLDTLAALARRYRPALEAASARVRAAGHDLDQARRERYPDLMVGVEYGQRTGFDDMVSLMVGVRLPIRPGAVQRPMQREREAMQAMEEAEARNLLNETWARLAERHAMAEQARELDRLYADGVLPQARAALEAARSAYRVGDADFMTLVESQMALNQWRIDHLRLVARFHAARADIAALLGGVLEGTP